MQLFVRLLSSKTAVVDVEDPGCFTVRELKHAIAGIDGVPAEKQRLSLGGRHLQDGLTLEQASVHGGSTVDLLLPLLGGMDFQNRDGSKFGGGGVMSETQANADRRERLRKLALETIDLNKDPYFMKNHLGTYECKLCLTLHNNEGNYLAHTQGKRHQQNLARRAAKEARDAPARPMRSTQVSTRKIIKIGRPGYKVTKARDLQTRQRSLIFEIDYPQAEEGTQPRHRFMSAFEQRIEAPNKDWQYLLFACDPYETVGFKIPNVEIDKNEGRFFTQWDAVAKKFTLQLYFREGLKKADDAMSAATRSQGPSQQQQAAPPPPPPLPANMVPPPPPPPMQPPSYGGGYGGYGGGGYGAPPPPPPPQHGGYPQQYGRY